MAPRANPPDPPTEPAAAARPEAPAEPLFLPRIVLIGAGHAHLQIVRWWGRKPIPDAELTLVSASGQAAYSGMLPGALAGQYPPDELLIDLPRLTARCGVQLIVDRAIRLDPVARRLELAHQPTVEFDVASINIGSVPAAEHLWQTHRLLLSVKPLQTFVDRLAVRLKELLAQWRDAGGTERLRLAVVGGGAAGVELALCLDERFHRAEQPIDVVLVDGRPEILGGHCAAAVQRARRLLSWRGIEVRLGQRVVGCEEEGPHALILDDGSRLPCDLAIWAAGAAPPAVLKGFDLPKSQRGFLLVRATLQSTAEVPIFAVGDVADWWGEPLPKAGVYAVRQAPVLWQNLRRFLAGERLQSYEPQRGFLALLNCGDGTAILDYRGWSVRSRWVWWLKRRIDRAFVRQFQ